MVAQDIAGVSHFALDTEPIKLADVLSMHVQGEKPGQGREIFPLGMAGLAFQP
jgi:hypothetical protein